MHSVTLLIRTNCNYELLIINYEFFRPLPILLKCINVKKATSLKQKTRLVFG